MGLPGWRHNRGSKGQKFPGGQSWSIGLMIAVFNKSVLKTGRR